MTNFTRAVQLTIGLRVASGQQSLNKAEVIRLITRLEDERQALVKENISLREELEATQRSVDKLLIQLCGVGEGVL